jgi:hypothetical protein
VRDERVFPKRIFCGGKNTHALAVRHRLISQRLSRNHCRPGATPASLRHDAIHFPIPRRRSAASRVYRPLGQYPLENEHGGAKTAAYFVQLAARRTTCQTPLTELDPISGDVVFRREVHAIILEQIGAGCMKRLFFLWRSLCQSLKHFSSLLVRITVRVLTKICKTSLTTKRVEVILCANDGSTCHKECNIAPTQMQQKNIRRLINLPQDCSCRC